MIWRISTQYLKSLVKILIEFIRVQKYYSTKLKFVHSFGVIFLSLVSIMIAIAILFKTCNMSILYYFCYSRS